MRLSLWFLQRRLRQPLDDVDNLFYRLDDDGLNVTTVLQACSGQDDAGEGCQLEVHSSLGLGLHLRLEPSIGLQRLAVKLLIGETFNRRILDELHLVDAPWTVVRDLEAGAFHGLFPKYLIAMIHD